MRISSVNQSPSMLGAAGTSSNDATTRSLQKQIADKQKQLQELSKRDDLSNEDKMKQRQELLKEIADLNSQLRQHEVELRREQQQSASGSGESGLGKTNPESKNGNERGADFSVGGMESLLSADASLKQAEVQGSVKTGLEGRARVLRGEIKQDASRGVSTEAKEAELSSVEGKAQQAGAAQLETLANANESLAGAKAEEKNPTTEDAKDVKDGEEVKTKAQEEAEAAAGMSAAQQMSVDISVGDDMDRKLSDGRGIAVDVFL